MEDRILKKNSKINDKIFPQWIEKEILKEQFEFKERFMYVGQSIKKIIKILSMVDSRFVNFILEMMMELWS